MYVTGGQNFILTATSIVVELVGSFMGRRQPFQTTHSKPLRALCLRNNSSNISSDSEANCKPALKLASCTVLQILKKVTRYPSSAPVMSTSFYAIENLAGSFNRNTLQLSGLENIKAKMTIARSTSELFGLLIRYYFLPEIL